MLQRLTKLFYIVIGFIFPFIIEGNQTCPIQWNGEEYHNHSTEQRYAASVLLSQIDLHGNEHVLDIGCGDGYNTFLLAERILDGSVLGIDASASMIDFAANHFQNDNLEFLLMDANELNFDNQFDLAIAFTVFHWIQDAKSALNGIHHSLKAKGKIILEIPYKVIHSIHPIHEAANEVVAKPEWKDYFINFDFPMYFRTRDEYEQLLQETHFACSNIQTYLVPNFFSSKPLFFNFLKQWFPYLTPLPEDFKTDFLEAVLKRYLELVPLENHQIPFHVHRMTIVAQKQECIPN